MQAPAARSRSFVAPRLVSAFSFRLLSRPVALDGARQHGFQNASFARRQVGFLVLGEDVEQENRNVDSTEECDDSIATPLSLTPPKRTFRAPPVPAITSPAAGFAAIHVTMAMRSDSGSPSARGSPRNAGVSTTVCSSQYTPLEYRALRPSPSPRSRYRLLQVECAFAHDDSGPGKKCFSFNAQIERSS
jgi:hypothetical protein